MDNIRTYATREEALESLCQEFTDPTIEDRILKGEEVVIRVPVEVNFYEAQQGAEQGYTAKVLAFPGGGPCEEHKNFKNLAEFVKGCIQYVESEDLPRNATMQPVFWGSEYRDGDLHVRPLNHVEAKLFLEEYKKL